MERIEKMKTIQRQKRTERNREREEDVGFLKSEQWENDSGRKEEGREMKERSQTGCFSISITI